MYLYRLVDKTFNNKKFLFPKHWVHYIPAAKEFLRGNSFTDKAHINQWKGNLVIIIDTNKLSPDNKIFPINGNRIYLLTQGLINKDFDPEAYKLESEEINEYFITGTINLQKAMIKKVKL
jgi:hypothetical protein